MALRSINRKTIYMKNIADVMVSELLDYKLARSDSLIIKRIVDIYS